MRRVVVAGAAALVVAGVAGCSGTPSPGDPGTDLGPDLGVATGPTAGASAARATAPAGGLAVVYPDGTDRTWSRVALKDLARTSVRAADGSTVTGVSLPTLVSYDGPPATAPEVATSRTSYVVEGAKGRVRIARGETEGGIGRHPALLTETADGRVDLVVSQDATTARSVLGVTRVTVDWAAAPPAVSAPARGAVALRMGTSPVTTTLRLATLPRHPYAVQVRSASGTRRHLEMGVSLAQVLAAARVPLRPSTLVTVVSSSGASASVTVGEELSAKKRMGFSFSQDGLAMRQPTFVVDGDASGARTVADVTQVVITS